MGFPFRIGKYSRSQQPRHCNQKNQQNRSLSFVRQIIPANHAVITTNVNQQAIAPRTIKAASLPNRTARISRRVCPSLAARTRCSNLLISFSSPLRLPF